MDTSIQSPAALIRVFDRGRPTVIEQDNCKVYISVHDEWFLRRLKELRQLILDCHPDRRRFTGVVLVGGGINLGGTFHRSTKKILAPHSTNPFLTAQSKLESFLKKEIKWYAQFGLTPPEY